MSEKNSETAEMAEGRSEAARMRIAFRYWTIASCSWLCVVGCVPIALLAHLSSMRPSSSYEKAMEAVYQREYAENSIGQLLPLVIDAIRAIKLYETDETRTGTVARNALDHILRETK